MNKGSQIEVALEKEGYFMTVTEGISMFPMLRDRRDTVVIRPLEGRLKKYDVPLYRRGDNYVLHRVIKVLPDEGYHIRGDNCIETEENIPEDAVMGILTEFWRGDKKISVDAPLYLSYSRFWVFIHPMVRIVKKIRISLRNIIKKRSDTAK